MVYLFEVSMQPISRLSLQIHVRMTQLGENAQVFMNEYTTPIVLDLLTRSRFRFRKANQDSVQVLMAESPCLTSSSLRVSLISC